jgi:hypothetical protein
MYKIHLLLFLFTGASWLSAAQAPTLTAANMNPLIGDKFVIHNCNTNNVLPGASGADTSWDFSSLATLSAQSIDTGTAIAAASTQTDALFPASNLAIITPSSSSTAYYIENDTILAQNGIYVSPEEYTAYSDPMDQLQFPFTYNNTFTDYYSSLVVYTPAGGSTVNAVNAGNITVTADAYGTLTLPGTPEPVVFSNVLRVHSIQPYTDSVGVLGAPLLEYTIESYIWYTPYYHNPLLIISTTTGSGVSTKLVSYSSLQLAGPERVASQNTVDASLELFPNPVKDELNIRYNTVNNENVNITLSDMLGREVAVIADSYTHGTQQLGYNTSGLPEGIYLVRFQTSAETITRKVEVE